MNSLITGSARPPAAPIAKIARGRIERKKFAASGFNGVGVVYNDATFALRFSLIRYEWLKKLRGFYGAEVCWLGARLQMICGDYPRPNA